MGSAKKYKRWSLEFKRTAVSRMKTCEGVSELARELKVYKNQLYKWRREIEGPPEAKYQGVSGDSPRAAEANLFRENQKLKSALAEKVLELDFFRSALRRVEEAGRSQKSGGPAFMPKSGPERSSKAD